MHQLLTECRASVRRPSDVRLQLVWKDAGNRIVHSSARCVDISDSGAGIEYREALAKLTPIQICAAESGIVRTGRVSSCTQMGSTYRIGIEFC